jgi:hypothetical protein
MGGTYVHVCTRHADLQPGRSRRDRGRADDADARRARVVSVCDRVRRPERLAAHQTLVAVHGRHELLQSSTRTSQADHRKHTIGTTGEEILASSAVASDERTVWQTIQHAGQEPFALLAHELDIVVGSIRSSLLAVCLGQSEDILPVRILEGDVNMPW